MRKLLPLLLVFSIHGAWATENEENFNLEKSNLMGTWKVISFLAGDFGKEYPKSDYLAASQIYGFYADGHVRSLVSDEIKSYDKSLTELEAHFQNKPAQLHYHFINSNHIAMTIDEERQLGTLWRLKLIEGPTLFNKTPLKKGDLLMGMTAKKSDKKDTLRYIRIMRKIPKKP